MLKKFIDRPILSTVISLIILVLGFVGLVELPITRFPDIAPPSVNISASYPGASAETVTSSVLMPLETTINGVEGMNYMRSKASTGSASITVYFKQGIDPDEAAVKVQNRVSDATTNLPVEVIESGVTVKPRQSGSIMTINIYSDDPSFDETFLQSFTNINIIRPLQRIDGVATVSRIGGRNYAVRIWLDPNKLRAYELVPSDIDKAIDDQNFEIAPGQFGQNTDQEFQLTIKYGGRFTSKEEFENIILKTTDEGSILRLKDVARVGIEATNTNAMNTVDGMPGLTMDITQNSGANARDIDIAIRQTLEELFETFPEGMKYNISYSVKDQVDNSIKQVVHTLIEAFILVFIIIFIFLQDLRTSIIPAITIPVALIGTFFVIYLLGFSINVLTMFALVLSIGIVVDDAIVVVEAIHEKMGRGNENPYQASVSTMGEIAPAIVSITLVMTAVFLPIGFMQGPSGIFYKQFAYTLAIAILISAINALTLSPALCSLILKNPNKDKDTSSEGQMIDPNKPKRKRDKARSLLKIFFANFNTAYDKMSHRYIKSIIGLIRRRKLALGGLVVISLFGFLAMKYTPSSFIPDEDNGFIIFSLKLPPGSSLARTNNLLEKAIAKFKDREEIKTISTSSGYNAIDNTTSSSYAMGYINMYPHNQRKGIRDINQFIDTLRADLSGIKDAEVSVYTRPTVQGFGDQNGVRFVVEDVIGEDFQALGKVSQQFLADLNARPEILQATTTFDANFPQMEIEVDREKAKVMGVGIYDMLNNVRRYYSRVRTSEFNLFNRLNFVYVQGEPNLTASPSSLDDIYARSKDGNMVPVSTLVKLRRSFGAEITTRHNMYNSVEVSAIPASGYSTGEVMDAIEEVTQEKLPGNYKTDWTGLSREEKLSSGQTAFIIILSFLFVYLLLTAQYESYILPLSILLSVPVGLIGVYGLINLVGLENNIYVQVGLLMLIGLLAKNAILIVEYSMQQRERGMSIVQSAIIGARLRLRPILMTSLAFVAGMIPLMWSSGPSAVGNHSISYAAAGGMLSGVILGVFIIPVLFVVFQTLDEKLKVNIKREK